MWKNFLPKQFHHFKLAFDNTVNCQQLFLTIIIQIIIHMINLDLYHYYSSYKIIKQFYIKLAIYFYIRFWMFFPL